MKTRHYQPIAAFVLCMLSIAHLFAQGNNGFPVQAKLKTEPSGLYDTKSGHFIWACCSAVAVGDLVLESPANTWQLTGVKQTKAFYHDLFKALCLATWMNTLEWHQRGLFCTWMCGLPLDETQLVLPVFGYFYGGRVCCWRWFRATVWWHCHGGEKRIGGSDGELSVDCSGSAHPELSKELQSIEQLMVCLIKLLRWSGWAKTLQRLVAIPRKLPLQENLLDQCL